MDTPATPRPLTHRETLLVVFGVLLPVFMGSLDNTILASALPTIGRDLGDVNNLPWLITAYLIANTAATPLYGKFSDIHGRRATLLIALTLHMAGSLICALAPNMLTLILGRVVQGVGSGALTATGMVILGDIAAPRERGKYYAYFSMTYTTAGACGPALGGFLAEYVHWKAIFWLNIPMGLLSIVLVFTLLRRLPRLERPHRLDVLGAILITVASVSFMLALNTGGVRYDWLSTPILALFAVAGVVGFGFVIRLLTAKEPLIPLDILANAGARLAILVNAFGWGAIVGLNIFLPMYLQSIRNMSATMAGLSVLVLSVALNLSAGVAGTIMPRMARYKSLPLAGAMLATAGVLLLAWRAAEMSHGELEVVLAVIGLGFGAIPPLCSTVLQNNVAGHQLGSAVGTMQFSRNLFCTMLVAGFGALVLVAPTGGGTVEYSADGFARAFYVTAASLALCCVALALIEEKPLRTAGP